MMAVANHSQFINQHKHYHIYGHDIYHLPFTIYQRSARERENCQHLFEKVSTPFFTDDVRTDLPRNGSNVSILFPEINFPGLSVTFGRTGAKKVATIRFSGAKVAAQW